jgi:hypothetical protein
MRSTVKRKRLCTNKALKSGTPTNILQGAWGDVMDPLSMVNAKASWYAMRSFNTPWT